MEKVEYSNYDFEQLTEVFFNNPWLRHEANYKGFEVLWFDYKTRKEKSVIKKLINHFNYVDFEQAELDFQPLLKSAINEWSLSPKNTIFVAFKPHKYADGSNMFLSFLRTLLFEIDDEWREGNFYSRIKYGNERIKEGGNSEWGIKLKNVVLIDDFVGTGRTAVNRYNEVKSKIANTKFEINLYLLSLGGMNFGLRYLYKNTFANYKTLHVQSKGTELAFSKNERKSARNYIRSMECILSEGNNTLKLQDHSLGWGQSETTFSISRFNLPNNNYPIFWWNRYRNNKYRKPLFRRMY